MCRSLLSGSSQQHQSRLEAIRKTANKSAQASTGDQEIDSNPNPNKVDKKEKRRLKKQVKTMHRIFVQNMYHILLGMACNESQQLWTDQTQLAADRKASLKTSISLKEQKKRHSACWVLFLKLSFPPSLYKAILVNMHLTILPRYVPMSYVHDPGI